MDEPKVYAFTRAELIKALQTKPVPGTLLMLEQQGGCPEDLADAIIQALEGTES